METIMIAMTSKQVGGIHRQKIVQFLHKNLLSNVVVSLETHATPDGGFEVVQQSQKNEMKKCTSCFRM